jgi:hypothetical protein
MLTSDSSARRQFVASKRAFGVAVIWDSTSKDAPETG